MEYRYFMVVSPTLYEVVPVTDEGQGPLEPHNDIVEIEARTKSDAKALGVKLMMEQQVPFIKWCRDYRENPYAGVTVTELTVN